MCKHAFCREDWKPQCDLFSVVLELKSMKSSGNAIFFSRNWCKNVIWGWGILFTCQCVNNYTVNVETGLHNENIIILWFRKCNCLILVIKSKLGTLLWVEWCNQHTECFRQTNHECPYHCAYESMLSDTIVCQHHYHAVSSCDRVDKVIRLCGHDDGGVCLQEHNNARNTIMQWVIRQTAVIVELHLYLVLISATKQCST